MRRTFLTVMLALATAGLHGAELVRERWAAKDTACAHPGALTVTQAGRTPRLLFDLSALPQETRIHHASLHCFTQGHAQPGEPARLLVIGKLPAGGEPVTVGEPLKLEPPWFRSFDITEAVRRWVAQPETNLGLAVSSFDKLLPQQCSLDILFEGTDPAPPAQATGVKVLHHDGQTFIIWKEHAAFQPKPEDVIWVDSFSERGDKLAAGPGQSATGSPRIPAITLKTLRELQGLGLRDKPSGFQGIKPLQRVRQVEPVAYRVYRHSARITRANLPQAELLAEVDPLSGYDDSVYWIKYSGEFLDQYEVGSSTVPTLCCADGQALLPGEGMYVHTTREAGKSFYAITMVHAGTENVSQFSEANAPQQPVAEAVAPPRPVLQFIQQDRYKDDVPEHWFKYWSGPPYYHLPSRMFRIAVGVPMKYAAPGPMEIRTISDDFNMREVLNLPSSSAITLALEQINGWTPDLCYNEGRGTLRALAECKVDYFSERHMLNLIEWAVRRWNVDRTKIAGSLLHFGLRHPEIFAHMSFGTYTTTYDLRWAPGSGSMPALLGPKGIQTVTGVDAWSEFSVGWYVNRYPERDIPFLICMSCVGKDSGHTSEFGWQDDPRGWAGLLKARQTFVAVWSMGFNEELPRALSQVDWTKTIPAFSNCSLDNNPGNGDPSDGDYYGTINGWLMCNNADSVDEPDRWEATLCLLPSTPRDSCSVDVTPRHCKRFKPAAGAKYKWSNLSIANNKDVQSGEATADQWGLLTMEKVTVTKEKNRIRIAK